MNEELALLDRIEEIRQKAAEDPASYPIDYTIRLISAMVAQYAGYTNRNGWTADLKKHPDSKYAMRIAEGRFHL